MVLMGVGCLRIGGVDCAAVFFLPVSRVLSVICFVSYTALAVISYKYPGFVRLEMKSTLYDRYCMIYLCAE